MFKGGLSIITPTLNSASTLRKTLESVQALVERGAEHIVVDSDSDDDTVSLAEAAGARVVRYPQGNMYAAINAGMDGARGEWLTYINSDNVLFADSVVEALCKFGSQADIVYGDIDFIDAYGRFLFSRRAASPANLAWLMRYYNPFPQQGTLFRRTWFDKVGGFNTDFRFAADLDFFIRCCEQGARFSKYRGKSVAAFRLMATQRSQSLRMEMAPEGIRIRTELKTRAAARIPDWLGRSAAALYRWSTNVDGMFLRWHRGRGQDSAWRL